VSRTLRFDIPAEDLPCSLRAWLKKRGFSHRVLTDLKKEDGAVTANGIPLKLCTYLTSPVSVTLRLPMQESVSVSSPCTAPDVPVVYEDDDLIVFLKPAQMPTHPVHGHQGDTLADFAARHAAESGREPYTFRPVGRLDRNTSGLVPVAKTAYAARVAVRKTYLAVAEGILTESGTVNAPIRQKEGSRLLREVGEGGAPAVTHYEPLLTQNGRTLLRLTLETGRTHQIRVHMAYLGHPLVGDELYGTAEPGLNRHALHCAELSFCHPVTGQPLTLSAPLPSELTHLLSVPHP